MAQSRVLAASFVTLLAACSDTTVRQNFAEIAFSPVTIDFGNQTAGTSVDMMLKISNPGRLELQISQASIVDDARSAFSTSELPTSIPAGGNVYVTVTYHAPAQQGPDGARLVFDSNADNARSAQVSLGGFSAVPCTGSQTDCGGVCVDTTSDDSNCGACGSSCTAPAHCVNSKCSCVPATCTAGMCGDMDDGCGGTAHCGGCQGSNETCVSNMCLSCPEQAAFNACGVCGGPTISGVGDTCTASSGCPSTLACNATNDGTVCTDVAKNECGVCGGPSVTGIGNACMTADGCPSMLACNATGDGTVCTDVAKNACGVCGGPTVTGVGAACMAASGCVSNMVCNATGDAAVCADVPMNACGVCGGPMVAGVGSACTTASGCASMLACNATGDGTVCTDVAQNACGICGGPAVSGVGDTCTATNGCPGTNACTAAGDAVTCNGPITCDVANHVVISQLSGYGLKGEYDEFIELYNPTASPIDLSGYSLWYRPASSTNNFSVLGPVSGTIVSHGYWLGVYNGSSADYTGTAAADFTYALGTFINLSASNGEVLLWNSATNPASTLAPSDPGIVDLVGYGTAQLYSGSAAAPGPLKDNHSGIIRKASPNSTAATLSAGGSEAAAGNGYDTNDNANDFVVVDTLVPRNSATTPMP